MTQTHTQAHTHNFLTENPTAHTKGHTLKAGGCSWMALGGSQGFEMCISTPPLQHLPKAAVARLRLSTVRWAKSTQLICLEGLCSATFHTPSSNTMFNSLKTHYYTFRHQSHQPSFEMPKKVKLNTTGIISESRFSQYFSSGSLFPMYISKECAYGRGREADCRCKCQNTRRLTGYF